VQAAAEATCHNLRAMPLQPSLSSGRGPGDDLASRIVVFGTLILIAAGVLGAVVALGLEGDEPRRARVATTATQTVTTQTTPRTATVPATTTPRTTTTPRPELEDTSTLPAPPAATPGLDDCSDGKDNDGDDLVDGAQDDGCLRDSSEAPANDPSADDLGSDDPELDEPPPPPAPRGECSDKRDIDRDGFFDDEDPRCPSASESPADLPN